MIPGSPVLGLDGSLSLVKIVSELGLSTTGESEGMIEILDG
jgi:hypothetical protein